MRALLAMPTHRLQHCGAQHAGHDMLQPSLWTTSYIPRHVQTCLVQAVPLAMDAVTAVFFLCLSMWVCTEVITVPQQSNLVY